MKDGDIEKTIRKVFYRPPKADAPWAAWIRRKQRDEAWSERMNKRALRKLRKGRKGAE